VLRRHLCVLLDQAVTGPVQRWRQRWDPVMAAVVPAHLTVVYPEEVVDEDLLLSRAESGLATTRPFRLRMGAVVAAEGGAGGVFVAVDDVDGAWAALRRALLAEPMSPVDLPAHVTLVHPRTSNQGPACWAALAGRRVDREVVARAVCLTETRYGATGQAGTADISLTVLRRFALADQRPR
jgi:hypothetical protein